MLGLHREIVEVVTYRSSWSHAFERERALLTRALGNVLLDIQHVGSTAVPGLEAKPIVDIAAAVEVPEKMDALKEPLQSLGYIDRGDAGDKGGYLFVKEKAPQVRTHHLHVVTINDPQWTNYLRFRDRLRSDTNVRRQYAELKKALQKEFALDRQGYTRAKHDFIRGVLNEGIHLG